MFILHGGFNPEKTDKDRSDFYKEILKNAPEDAKVLLVPFAKDSDRITEATEKVTVALNKNKWQKKININIADERDFLKQLHIADVVYFHGGTSLKLLGVLKNYKNLGEILNGRIVAGESAGANVWGKFFYSTHADAVFEGLGILPIKIIPHYKKEYDGKLDNVGIGLELVTLPEYTYKIFLK